MSLTTTDDDALAPSADPGSQQHEAASSSPETQASHEKNHHPPPTSPQPKPSVSHTPTPTNQTESPLVTKALNFAATATPSTVGGIAVGVSAVLYVILGRIALLFIGAIGGVLAFVIWEARNPEVARAVRGEKGLDVLERLQLSAKELRTDESGDNGEDDDQFTLKALDEFRPETREALAGLTDAIIRDYVKWWYNPIVPSDHSFPLACRKTLTSYFLAISNHLYRKRPTDAFLDLLTNSSSVIIVFMSELASAFTELSPEADWTAADVILEYRAANPDCRLNSLLNQHHQNAKFRTVADDLLNFLDRSAHGCDPARIFLREIFTNSILETTLQTCSKPEWINGWIVYLLEAGEPDLNQAIDVGMQTGPDASQNVLSDFDGNVGNVNIAKPSRGSAELDRSRAPKAAPGHKKKLSKADEEMEVAVEEMKKLNAMIAAEEKKRERAATIRTSAERPANIAEVAESIKEQNRSVDPNEPSPSAGVPRNKHSPPGTSTSTDGLSTTSEAIPTPLTPQSNADATSPKSGSPQQPAHSHFTNFDQIQPQTQNAEVDEDTPAKKAPLTLHNASFTLHDDNGGEKGKMRNKPSWDYLIQVEPSSASYPGWMIVRRYSDFETLHEILRRIAAVSGATAFTELHKELPQWRIHTRESLRGELERYLRDACWYHSLAESEGMKRFLEKSQGHTHGDSKNFGWETVGKNMLDVLTIAPKGAMEGGRTLVGGVQGVLGNFPGLSRKSTSQSADLTPSNSGNRLSITTPPRMETKSPASFDRASMDSQRSSIVSTQPGKIAPMERRPSYQSQQGDADSDYFRMGRGERMDSTGGGSGRPSREHSRASSLAPLRSPSTLSLGDLRLPPHPDEIADDYDYARDGEGPPSAHARHTSLSVNLEGRPSISSPKATSPGLPPSRKWATKPARQYSQMSEPETRVAVELLFAVINEMYTLSSAWNIRRTLLTAAKSFLLRPGNPSLLTVQNLIQTSVLDSNTSDAGLAEQLRKLRENTMPTDEERAAWPEEMTDEEKEKLRVKARQLLIRSGVPAALMGVMGQAATSEALGRVFDSLQIEEVARGLIFVIMLQVVKVVTH